MTLVKSTTSGLPIKFQKSVSLFTNIPFKGNKLWREQIIRPTSYPNIAMTRFSIALRALSSRALKASFSRGNSHKKLKFSTHALRDTKISFDGRGPNEFLPLRGANSNTSWHFLFRLNTLKLYCDKSNGVILDFSTLSGRNLQMVTLKSNLPPRRAPSPFSFSRSPKSWRRRKFLRFLFSRLAAKN